MFKVWKKNNNLSEPKRLNGIVRVIGGRNSGKTTYMAALARWPKADKINGDQAIVQQVQAINNDGEKLIETAKNILEHGDSFEGTDLRPTSEVKDYLLRIVLKNDETKVTSKINPDSSPTNLDINCKDYSGEFFSDLLHKSGSSELQDYIEDCVVADGIMLLLDGMGFRQDERYVGGLERFLTELDRAETEERYRRIAIVITKCEQPELWVNRHNPRLIVEARFPKIWQKLKEWERMGAGNIDCFTTSAFGMVGNRYQKANMECISRDQEGINVSVLKYPKQWQPFGLVSPIYWLCIGKRHPKLDLE